MFMHKVNEDIAPGYHSIVYRLVRKNPQYLLGIYVTLCYQPRLLKADDRRMIKSIFSVKLEPSATAEFNADKIGRFYRSCVMQYRPIFCHPTQSADFIVRLSSA